ncbi:hypothetical protein J7W19_21065 [Streptomyces mobaraensis NBRC 13819 = DSM 40847]|uniref:Uncharacterized protein n=1 Tax=Streptomyces mobaraensis (strain ATCC 29032 / DSM 40847 / JCM 4168 / NBRC 13819 / NCIMB 11159 / IPCR 16-22) TaxID=1223523 RepID=M2ZZ41_STRM1|nr:hypothetical protein [Streptomyces mobaraensis]EME98048.1 hypothetical protein H340_23368 [Streptomyces mobaraensis NBRC 13819 = DSM 40847]QTT75538.1 hypothetical protein J7W19_21065 [Streptomyces mobaraensis NBRC 13819 = DSM 40847]
MVHRTEADHQRRRDLADDVAGVARLLPWVTDDGRPCYLATDGAGWLSALADNTEAVQLALGAELLERVNATMGAPKLSDGELRYLVARLYEALGDALRVAESRGKRLPGVDADGGGEGQA